MAVYLEYTQSVRLHSGYIYTHYTEYTPHSQSQSPLKQLRAAVLAWSFRNRSTRISAGNNKITQQVQILLCLLSNIYKKNAPMENHPNFGVINFGVQHTEARCNTLQQAATHCNTHCSTRTCPN